MADLTSAELREIEDSHFMAIAQALVGGATNKQCEALKNLIFWRQRDLRSEQVQKYKPGEIIVYLLPDSETEAEGTIHHLNKLSVSIHLGNGRYDSIPVERILRYKKAIHVAPVTVFGSCTGDPNTCNAAHCSFPNCTSGT